MPQYYCVKQFVQATGFFTEVGGEMVYNLIRMIKLSFDQRKLDEVCRKHGVIAVYLHGSRVKGYAASDSDTDIAIVVKDRSKLKTRGWGVYNVASDIEDVLGLPGELDIRVVDKDSSPVFLFEIIRSGKLVSEKDLESRVEFESQVMQRYYDTEKMHSIYRTYLYSNVKEAVYAN